MDDIRRFAVEMSRQFAGNSVEYLIETSRILEAYLREPVPCTAVISEDPEDEKPFELTEEAVIAAMLGEYPETEDVLRQAVVRIKGLENSAERVFDD